LYTARFDDDALARLASAPSEGMHFLIDRRVADIYRPQVEPILRGRSVLLIDATEENKSLERFPAYVEHLVSRGLRRNHVLVAIGGGIIQDITCFLAATMLRGVPWQFYPTTLLAQADSCIGSKSSINCRGTKNILGTFTPPAEIVISTRFLKTLAERDVRSGIGEMLKVHAIDGPESFDRIARDYERLLSDDATLMQYIRRSLEIKKRIIEADEFDRGIRNVMNYGHSFGHAIEAATEFAIPHGIAVTIGMDMANYVASRRGGAPASAVFQRMHDALRKNYSGFERTDVPLDAFSSALAKDKKNVDAELTLILPDAEGHIRRTAQKNDGEFRTWCAEYLERVRAA
jgi:3-dehydroquinate synthase